MLFRSADGAVLPYFRRDAAETKHDDWPENGVFGSADEQFMRVLHHFFHTDTQQAGVGAFGDLGTHSLDIMMWLMGDVLEATATVSVVTGRYGTCDETGQGLMKFRNGVSGALTAGWVDVANPVTLEIAGTEGHAVIVNDALFFQSKHVEGADGKQPWTKLPPALRVPMHQWVDAIAGRTEGVALVTPAEAAARVAVMEAMYAGARSDRWVKVS